MAQQFFSLAEATTALKTEIMDAVAQRQGDITFELGNIELEFSVVAQRSGGANGKVEFKVLGLGPTAEFSADISSERIAAHVAA